MVGEERKRAEGALEATGRDLHLKTLAPSVLHGYAYIFLLRKLQDLSLVPLERASSPLSNGTRYKSNGGLDANLWRVYGSRRFAHPPCVRCYVEFFSSELQGSPLVPLDREKFPLSNGTKHVPNGRLDQML